MFACGGGPLLKAAYPLQKAARGEGWPAAYGVSSPKLREDFVTDGTSGASRHGRTSREPEDLWNIPVLQNMLVLWQVGPVCVIHFYLPDAGDSHVGWAGGKRPNARARFLCFPAVGPRTTNLCL